MALLPTIEDLIESISYTRLVTDKTLHEVSRLIELVGQRTARPFYSLDNNWGLTSLNTGQPFFVNTKDRNITPWLIMGGSWEPNVERVLLAYSRPGMVVLDIGAHCGYYTVKLGTKIGPSGKLMAFEPNPEVNAVCLENIKINGLASHCTLYKLALGAARGTAILTRSESNMASANLMGDQDADFTVTVDVSTIDDMIPNNVEVDLIKLDAEGYEKHILDGGASTIQRSLQCSIMIELGLERWERVAELSVLIEACGGHREIFAVQNDGTLKHFHLSELRPFLETCPFHENYFLISTYANVERYVGDLLIK